LFHPWFRTVLLPSIGCIYPFTSSSWLSLLYWWGPLGVATGRVQIQWYFSSSLHIRLPRATLMPGVGLPLLPLVPLLGLAWLIGLFASSSLLLGSRWPCAGLPGSVPLCWALHTTTALLTSMRVRSVPFPCISLVLGPLRGSVLWLPSLGWPLWSCLVPLL
jgi:hypothetical protein